MAAEITAGFLGPALQVVKWVSAPILRQFKYLCCFTTNITNLENEAKELQDAERDLQGRVDAARNDVQLITSEVETWLQNSKEIINEEDVITKEVPKVKGGCLKLRARFSLSKRAVKTADRLKEFRDQCKFDIISRPRPPPAMEAFPLERTCEFESRKQIEEDIMSALRGEDVIMMGICGMGGLGKTTTAKRIMNRALEEHVFDEVVMAVISQEIDKLKIQLEIGGSLHLNLKDETSQADRAKKLLKRLSGTKRILLVLDDVWEELALEDLGIPRGYKGCTILLTSRNREALKRMDVQNIFDMEVLSAEDSWTMFRDRVGPCVDNTELSSIAKEVVNECKGLPLALTTVGASQIGEMNVDIWKNTLRQLRRNDPDIPEYIAQAHKYLKGEFTLENSFLEGIRDLSVICIERYSLLSLPHTTQMLRNLNTLLLYLCTSVKTLSVIGELVNLEILICHDCDSIEELPPEIQGLNRLKVLELTGCRNLKRIGRCIISSLVGLEELKMLKSFKKWEGEDRKQRENAGLKELGQLHNLRCLEIEIEDLALATENIGLSLKVDRFTIRFLYESRWFSNFDKYLSNKKMRLKWEGATCLGDWIKMLLLRDTECLLLVGNGADEVGLTNLEKKIRYLVLGECESMKKVVTSSMGATVFPSIEHLLLFELPKLEEICDDRISSNSFQNLRELKLDDLPVLKQLWMSSQNDLGKDFLPQLEGLYIGNCGMMETVFLWKGEDGNENTSCHHITKIFPKLKELELRNLPNLISLCQGIEGIEFPLPRRMEIKGCRKMKGMTANGVTNNENNSGGTHHIFCEARVSFGCLKQLNTDRNPFCCHTIRVSLLNGLEELRIFRCPGSVSLFTSSMAGNLVNLKELWIRECDEMVEVIKDDEEKSMSGGQRTLLFPKLQELELWRLPKLVSFCESNGIESIQFPVLRSMKITECDKMKGMVADRLTSKENNSGGDSSNASDTIHLFCESQQVSFGCLKQLNTDRNPFCCHTIRVSLLNGLEELEISNCAGSRSLFTSSMAGNLLNLKELRISECEEMVEVMKDGEEKGMSGTGCQRACVVFPKLQKLVLFDLPELEM